VRAAPAGSTAASLNPVASETHPELIQYLYAVTYGWPGLPTTTKIVDLQRQVTVGTQFCVDLQWWA